MKLVLWGGIALLALIWTGGAALLVEAVRWSIKLMPVAGSMPSIDAAASNIVIPVWLSPWVDLSGWTAVLQTVQDVLESLLSVLPSMGSVFGWLITAIWFTWGFGLLIMLAGVVIGTLMLRRFK